MNTSTAADPASGMVSASLRAAVASVEAAVLVSTPALVCVIDASASIAMFNPALEQATGWAAHEVLGRPFCEVLAVPHEAGLARDAIDRALATGEAPPQEGDWLDRWGGHRRVAMQNSVLRDASGTPVGMVCVGVDVTARRAFEAELRERANTDVLTGLRNRAGLLTALTAELEDDSSPGCGLLFCDLDGFKAVNDTYGHDVGDRLLREVAGRLLSATDSQDVVTRLGGDEFVVLCPRTPPARVLALADEVTHAVEHAFRTRNGPVSLGISVGIAVGKPGDWPEDLLAIADRHMYGVKTSRRQG